MFCGSMRAVLLSSRIFACAPRGSEVVSIQGQDPEVSRP